MAEEPLTIRGISWRQTFPFVNIFRAFRVAVHPSKLVLALAALILLYISGQVLDALWVVSDRAVPEEVAEYEQFSSHPRPGEKFSDLRAQRRLEAEKSYALQLQSYDIEKDHDAALRIAHNAGDLGLLKNKIVEVRGQEIEKANAKWKKSLAAADEKKGSAAAEARAAADRDHETESREIYADASAKYHDATQIKNIGLFEIFSDYESNQVSNVVRAVREWNWFGQDRAGALAAADDGFRAAALGSAADLHALPGVIQSLYRFFTVGPIWLLTQHPLYFLLFGLIFLMLWSIFGGAICRIAAVHLARDEKLSIRSALMFSSGKFLSFLFAPIIPIVILVGVGLLVSLAALIANVPAIGPIIVGAFFFLALAAGFLMSLVLLGLIGGFNLMYPTVAVEGSDSFDAISRSFSYLYARPWRLGFYTIVAVIYGATSFLFVRLFIYLILLLAHSFASVAIFTHAESTAPLWTTMWPNPGTAARLSYEIDTLGLTFAQEIGARLIWLWVHLIIAMLGAFVVCFYFSANTIIYYLLRREVDATDMDDVYLEQIDDEFADPMVPQGESGTAGQSSSAAATESDITPPT